jgi:hypothetical protein
MVDILSTTLHDRSRLTRRSTLANPTLREYDYLNDISCPSRGTCVLLISFFFFFSSVVLEHGKGAFQHVRPLNIPPDSLRERDNSTMRRNIHSYQLLCVGFAIGISNETCSRRTNKRCITSEIVVNGFAAIGLHQLDDDQFDNGGFSAMSPRGYPVYLDVFGGCEGVKE